MGTRSVNEAELVNALLAGNGAVGVLVVWMFLGLIKMQRQVDALKVELHYFIRESREWRVLMVNAIAKANLHDKIIFPSKTHERQREREEC